MKTLSKEQIDKYINQHFEQKLMNDSKWRKVCEVLTAQDEKDVSIFRFKLVHESDIRETAIHCIENDLRFNWIVEPRLFKEVEWLEIPLTYKTETFKDCFETKTQNIKKLFEELLKLGHLPIELTKEKLKLTAYL